MRGKRLKRARMKAGVTIPRLARFVGISERDLILIEGEKKPAKPHEIELIAYYLKRKGVML